MNLYFSAYSSNLLMRALSPPPLSRPSRRPGSALGQAEHALADNVVLNFVRTGRDRRATAREHPMGPFATIYRALGVVFELAIRPQQLHRESLNPQIEVARAELHHRSFGSRRQPPELTRELAIAGVAEPFG